MKVQILMAAAAVAIVTAASPVLAQTTGEADASGCRAASSAPATAADKARAREARRAEGTQVARASTPGDDKPCATGEAGSASKQDRKAAAARRKADASAALKSGEIKSGEK